MLPVATSPVTRPGRTSSGTVSSTSSAASSPSGAETTCAAGTRSAARARDRPETADTATTRCPMRSRAAASTAPTRPAPTTPTVSRAGRTAAEESVGPMVPEPNHGDRYGARAMTYVPWEQAWRSALYGDGGFFHRPEGPGGHFRTSATSRVFAAALHRLAAGVDRALGLPDDFTFVDVGAGRGELLGLLAERVPDRWRLLAVEVAARPADLTDRIEWSGELSSPVRGLVLAHELLDAVPCVIAECGPDGAPAVVEVEPTTGEERLGRPLDGA